jgi:hypothetical protein
MEVRIDVVKDKSSATKMKFCYYYYQIDSLFTCIRFNISNMFRIKTSCEFIIKISEDIQLDLIYLVE